MKLNTEIKITSVYNKETDSNSIEYTVDLKSTLIDVMTTIEMSQKTLENLIKEAALKHNPKNLDKWIKKATLEEVYNILEQ